MSIVKKSKEQLLSNLPTTTLTLISQFSGTFYISRNRKIKFRCNICYANMSKFIYYYSMQHLNSRIHKEIFLIIKSKKIKSKKLINV